MYLITSRYALVHVVPHNPLQMLVFLLLPSLFVSWSFLIDCLGGGGPRPQARDEAQMTHTPRIHTQRTSPPVLDGELCDWTACGDDDCGVFGNNAHVV